MYEDVQIQPDAVSCGVFACAIATSLALGRDPVTEKYYVDEHVDHDGKRKETTLTMRQHLLRIINEKTLSPFPAMGITATAPSSMSTTVQNQNSDGLDKQRSPTRTYASVCRTPPRHVPLAPQSTIDSRAQKSKQQYDSYKTDAILPS